MTADPWPIVVRTTSADCPSRIIFPRMLEEGEYLCLIQYQAPTEEGGGGKIVENAGRCVCCPEKCPRRDGA